MTVAADPRELRLKRLAELDAVITRKCEQSFASFVRQAWKVLEPAQKMSWNWHIDLICGELQDITEGVAKNDVAINIPPGAMKSYILLMWNAWEWGPRKLPHMRYLCASHSQPLSSRDNQRVRDLIQSAWYQARWPDVQLKDDQNQKTRFNTTSGGWRIGTSVGASVAMGEHPHRKIIDDAHDPENVPGENERDAVWHWFQNTLGQRGYALNAVTIVSGQRLHEDDVFGRIRSRLSHYTWIVLPQWYEPPKVVDGVLIEKMKPTPSGRNDIRTKPGDLLWPTHITEAALAKSIATLGGPSSEGVAAQHQQSPMAPGGNMFKRAWFDNILEDMPGDVIRFVRFWDVAGTEGGTGAQTAGVKMGERLSGGFVLCADIVNGRWGDADVDKIIKQTARLDGKHVIVREEIEGGSSGKAITNQRARSMPGYDYAGVKPIGEKPERARGFRTQAEAGNVVIVARTDDERRKAHEAIEQLATFPRGTLKDIVDAISGAFNTLVSEDFEVEPPKPKITDMTIR